MTMARPLPRSVIHAVPRMDDYADTGCEVAPRCLECPLARCRYDEPAAVRQYASHGARDERVRAAYASGGSPTIIAKEQGISVRQVHRILSGR